MKAMAQASATSPSGKVIHSALKNSMDEHGSALNRSPSNKDLNERIEDSKLTMQKKLSLKKSKSNYGGESSQNIMSSGNNDLQENSKSVLSNFKSGLGNVDKDVSFAPDTKLDDSSKRIKSSISRTKSNAMGNLQVLNINIGS